MRIEALQHVMLAMTQERSPARVMQVIVDGLTSDMGFGLARIWTRGPGDRCDTCRFAEACPDRRECLHLIASQGHSIAAPREAWTNTEGGFSRFPLGHRKIGRIGASGDSLLIQDVSASTDWIADREWAAREQVRSFAGHPLVFRGEVLGVLGIFCREGLTEENFRWLRVFADQAAVAIVNARAFEEIDHLREQLEEENALLRAEVLQSTGDDELIGESAAIRGMREQIALVAPTEAAVMIEGESGSGKEVVARTIHRRSRRAGRTLVRVNCAAIPRELFESEFFGHVKGAFTGAVRDRIGRFQLADRGTLFLDEIGEIPLELQSKLLRVLQEGEFERIGDQATRRVDVRIIAATNRDLQREVQEGRFREDLFYRLRVFPLKVPSLRERTDDIPLLARHFLGTVSERLGVPAPGITPSDMKRLQEYGWPGNVRELSHVVERAIITADRGRANFSFLGGGEGTSGTSTGSTGYRASNPTLPEAAAEEIMPDRDLRTEQIRNIERALRESGGKIYGKDGAAARLGLRPTTLSSRIKRWGIERPV